MQYPSGDAAAKHDLLFHKMHDDSSTSSSRLQDAHGLFANSSAIFRALENDAVPADSLRLVANVYSYSDAPSPPLSRKLFVIGVAETSLSVVRKLVGGGGDDETLLPDCLKMCRIAVKKADAQHIHSLEERYVKNSTAFGKFMQRLRQEGLVGIIALDKYKRFGILKPIDSSSNSSSSNNGEELQIEDCFAACYVGNVAEVKSFLLKGNVAETEEEATAEAAVRPETPPVPENGFGDNSGDGSGGDLWKPPGNTSTTADASTSTGLWQPPGADSSGGGSGGGGADTGDLWKPPGDDNKNNQGDSTDGMWQPPGSAADTQEEDNPWEVNNATNTNTDDDNPWEVSNNYADTTNDNNKRGREDDDDHANERQQDDGDDDGDGFHSNAGAAAADRFYSALKRSLETRADSRLFHMRSFNGWVKATQIQELDPKAKPAQGTKNRSGGPMRVLDLGCGKGGDLGKWVLHPRGICDYVGSDVARGSLVDAAIRVRNMRQKLKRCTFTCADLGSDVPGRLRSAKHKQMQKLLTWSLQDEKPHTTADPEFKMVRGGGIKQDEKFDVVSIQFAIHYMMQTRKRARRFFRTVSELLEVGGNLICTTMDAEVVVGHLLNLGINFHFDDESWESQKEIVVKVGGGACQIRFEPDVVKKLFACTSDGTDLDEDLFGLEYTFTLVEGSDHEAGVGDAVNLPEWLIPIPVLTALGKEVGLEIEYAKNFHEFYADRSDPSTNAGAHNSLYNMRVLNRNGSISNTEWEISRLYTAIKFRKVREPTGGDLEESDGEEEEVEESDGEEEEKEIDPKIKLKLMPMAMMKAKKAAGNDVWSGLSGDEKTRLCEIELVKLAKATG